MAVHGTGTPLGDPIEIGALAAALASRSAPGLTVGSVKVMGNKQSAEVRVQVNTSGDRTYFEFC